MSKIDSSWDPNINQLKRKQKKIKISLKKYSLEWIDEWLEAWVSGGSVPEPGHYVYL